MAKFCGKCGTKLDEKTGLCPKCEKENIAQENVKLFFFVLFCLFCKTEKSCIE